MVRLKAHYDGKVLVPDGPVQLPQDVPLDITVDTPAPEEPVRGLEALIGLGAEIWRGVDGLEYQQKEREGWE